MAERDTRERTRRRSEGSEDRTKQGQEEDYHGESATVNPMAPESAGRPHGGEGVVEPADRPDSRPEGGPTAEGGPSDEGETPVRSPADRGVRGQDVKTGSAAGAAKVAGSRGPGEKEPEDERGS